MIFLDALDLVKPDIGLLFWTTLIFLLLWFLLGKFAFKPIANALRDRETSIDEALSSAEKARAEVANLKADNERVLNEAKEERARIIKESKEIGQKIVEDAKLKAKDEAAKVTEDAMAQIQNEKMAAIMDVKNMIGNATVGLSEKVLSRELGTQEKQQSFIEQELERINLG